MKLIFIYLLIIFYCSCKYQSNDNSDSNLNKLYIESLNFITKNVSQTDTIFLVTENFDFRDPGIIRGLGRNNFINEENILPENWLYQTYLPLGDLVQVVYVNENSIIDDFMENKTTGVLRKYDLQDSFMVDLDKYYAKNRVLLFSPFYFSSNTNKGVFFITEIYSKSKAHTLYISVSNNNNLFILDETRFINSYIPEYQSLKRKLFIK